MDPNSNFLPRPKTRLFVIFCAFFSFLALLFIPANHVFAENEDEQYEASCQGIAYKADNIALNFQDINNGTNSTAVRILYICTNKMSPDGTIQEEIYYDDHLSDIPHKTSYIGIIVLGRPQDEERVIKYSYWSNVGEKDGVAPYVIGETKLHDLAENIKDDLIDEYEDINDHVWKKEDNLIEKKGSEAQGIIANSNGSPPTVNGGNSCTDLSSLGWFLCPIIDGISMTTKAIYKDMIVPMLQVEPDILTSQNTIKGNSTFQAWRIFQNFANIALIILIIVVIFSQLTGIGIDNYGIKKTLPKLIVAIVLINLSYILSQIVVDLANILGQSLESLFNGMSQNIISVATPDNLLSNITTGAISGGIIIAIVTAMVAIPGAGAAVAGAVGFLIVENLPIIIGALLAVLVSILFFFAILAVRKAGVILLIVVSPLAFLCYILPNTKSIFDKWRKAFVGLILLYPICGALVGGAGFASALMLSIGGNSFGSSLIAMLINIIPIFFIPTILKSSMAALGNIGAKISSFGGKISGGAKRMSSKAILNNEGYKAARLEQYRNRKLNYNQRLSDRLTNKQKKNGGVLSARDSVRLANAQSALLSDENELLKAKESEITNSGEINDTVVMQEKLTQAILNDDATSIRAYQNILSAQGSKGRQAVHQAMVEATKRSQGNISDSARQVYASNIMNKWGADYKSNSRSTYNYAAANKGETAAGNIESYEGRPTILNDLTRDQIATMDDEELARIAKGLQGNQQAQKLFKERIQETLNDSRYKAKMKGGREVALNNYIQYDQLTAPNERWFNNPDTNMPPH